MLDPKIFSLTYVSSARTPFSKTELLDILTQSRIHNAQHAITGLLLYKEGNIIQVLEGEENTIWALYDKIAQDPRHHGLIVLLRATLVARQFPNWSMGFKDLNESDALTLPGYNEFLNTPLTSAEFAEHPTRCQKLLQIFKQNTR